MGKFVLRKVATGYKFDLRAANGYTVATSEVYATGAACRKGVQSVKKNLPCAALADLTEGKAEPVGNPKVEVYADKAGDFRFRLRSRNGKIIAVSDPYTTKSACLSGLESARRSAVDAPVLETR